ncbi:hypothetical protein H6P81_011263 [Aristolochia fimbriata]|uniref:Uncharacterized protein n=1 Tax=Aristolochia fimbriata TaxID=158543 RepID=A0AAV7ER17_ARIFI|nr:hypothetical protein H6P81_011263 [Aristolochia fimbriata]
MEHVATSSCLFRTILSVDPCITRPTFLHKGQGQRIHKAIFVKPIRRASLEVEVSTWLKTVESLDEEVALVKRPCPTDISGFTAHLAIPGASAAALHLPTVLVAVMATGNPNPRNPPPPPPPPRCF